MKTKKIVKTVFVKAPIKVLALPVTIPVSKTLRTNHKYIRESTTVIDSVPCPFCGVGHLYAVNNLFRHEFEVETQPLSNGQYWQCNVCTDHIITKTNNIKELINYIEINGRQLYEQGYAYQYRQELIESGELDYIVDKRVKMGSYFFYGNLLTLPAFLYGMFTGYFMFAIGMLLFGVLLGLTGVSYSYRAWQQYTDSVFTEKPREQFIWWLRNRSWFLSPYKPEYQDNLYYDNYDSYEVANFSQLIFDYVVPYHVEDAPHHSFKIPDLTQLFFYPYYFEKQPVKQTNVAEQSSSTVTQYKSNPIYPSSISKPEDLISTESD